MELNKKSYIAIIILIILIAGGIFGFVQWQSVSAEREAKSKLEEDEALEFNEENFFDFAVSFGNVNAVELFLEGGMDVDTKNEQGETALMIAVKEDLKEVAEVLIDNGADLSVTDENGRTALSLAVQEENFDMVEYLLDEGAEINYTDDDGRTPLSWARDEEMAQLLIENGADIEEPDEGGHTDLMKAARRGQTGTVEVLLNEGLGVNETDNDGQHSLIYVASYFKEEHPEMIELLIDEGAEVNHTDDDGRTALHWAVEKGHIETIEILLENGAEINIQDDEGDTPLIIAAPMHQDKYLEIAEILLDADADPEITDKEDRTALDWAESNGTQEMENLLREAMGMEVEEEAEENDEEDE
ncbi:MAG: ankyrin repeat domain-containing protein [bacterium]